MDRDKSLFSQFKSNLIKKGLEFFGLYYGAYRGEVVSNEDPLNMGRVQIKCNQLYGNQTPKMWVMGRGMISGLGYGAYWIPKKGDPIFVSCENGNPRFPMWEYGWWLQDKLPSSATPGNYLFRTPSGHLFEMDDNNKEVKITHASGQSVILNDDQTIDILGNADNAVRFSELKSAYDELRDDLNSLISSHNVHIHLTTATVGATAVPGVISPTGSAVAPSTGDISAAKINEIKTP